MSVKPELVNPQPPPPGLIRVILDCNETTTVEVELTLKVAAIQQGFKVGTKLAATTEKGSAHIVTANPVIDSVYYLHDWGPATHLAEVEVTVKLGESTESRKARVGL